MKYAITAAALFLSTTMALAEDCPPGATSCKVVIMTPEEIATLTQPGGIFDLAVWANRANMTGVIDAWKKKIEASAQGTVKASEHKQ